jgi:hypothetical protein
MDRKFEVTCKRGVAERNQIDTRHDDAPIYATDPDQSTQSTKTIFFTSSLLLFFSSF